MDESIGISTSGVVKVKASEPIPGGSLVMCGPDGRVKPATMKKRFKKQRVLSRSIWARIDRFFRKKPKFRRRYSPYVYDFEPIGFCLGSTITKGEAIVQLTI